MIDTLISQMDISAYVGTPDIIILLAVCGIVELVKKYVFKDNAKFKSFCPYVSTVLAIICVVVYGMVTKAFPLKIMIVKGIIDGGLAVLCYDAIVAKVKKTIIVSAIEDKLDSVVKG